MVRMFDLFCEDNIDQEFKFLHVFTRIESCEKWTECRLALARPRTVSTTRMRLPRQRQKGRLDGTKRAKTMRDATPGAEWLQSSIEQCIADAKSNATKREEKPEAR
ncbi:putative methionyl-tRNA synthetase [Hordeum vulgare]|nr:putative methionyl-tRNA synthetase [Hordeum vulgare]